MPHEVSRFKLGLFVIIGLLIILGAVVWLGALRYFQPGRTYVTFFNESVQGLQRDSMVKYRGVDVGRVVDIQVAPDYKLIEVVMQVHFHGEPERDMVAQLKSVGITGIVFVELDLRKPGTPDRSPKVDFATEDPIIPSRPSEMSEILSVVDKVATELKQVNFKAIGQDLEGILEGARKVVENPSMHKALDSLEGAAGRLDKVLQLAEERVTALDTAGISGDARGMLQEGKKVLDKVDQLVASTRDMMLEAKSQVEGLELDARAHRMESLVGRVGSETEGLLEELSLVVQNLTRVSRDLGTLVHELKDSPSRLIFSTPPAPRREGER